MGMTQFIDLEMVKNSRVMERKYSGCFEDIIQGGVWEQNLGHEYWDKVVSGYSMAD